MSIILGLVAAICWGSADFLARYATRLIGTYRALFTMQLFGLAGLSAYLLARGELVHAVRHTTWQPWAWCLLATALEIAASLSLYRAFEVGTLSVVSPIAASYAALTVVLSVLSGEQLTLLDALGIAAAMIGVALAAARFSSHGGRLADRSQRVAAFVGPGVGLASLSAVLFGVSFWLFGFQVTPALGGVIPVWVIRLMTPLTLAVFARPSHQSLGLPRTATVWRLLAGVGFLDTAAFVANTVGLTTGDVAIVQMLAAQFTAVTVLLAWLILRERLYWSQWVGVGLICVGVGLVSVG